MLKTESKYSNGNILYSVSSEPAVEPVTSTELKTFARIDGTAEDTLIDGFIKAARVQAELYLNRKLITQSITATLDYWPSEHIALPQPPLQSITSIKTLDEDDTATTYSSDNYYIGTKGIKGSITIKQGSTFPDPFNRTYGGIEIVFVAGYGDASTDVPQSILEGIKLWAASMYAKRVITDKPPPEAEAMLRPYRVNNL